MRLERLKRWRRANILVPGQWLEHLERGCSVPCSNYIADGVYFPTLRRCGDIDTNGQVFRFELRLPRRPRLLLYFGLPQDPRPKLRYRSFRPRRLGFRAEVAQVPSLRALFCPACSNFPGQFVTHHVSTPVDRRCGLVGPAPRRRPKGAGLMRIVTAVPFGLNTPLYFGGEGRSYPPVAYTRLLSRRLA